MKLYNVEVDGVRLTLRATSLAEVANPLRGTGDRIKVWVSESGIQMIDTKFGDAYGLVQQEVKS